MAPFSRLLSRRAVIAALLHGFVHIVGCQQLGGYRLHLTARPYGQGSHSGIDIIHTFDNGDSIVISKAEVIRNQFAAQAFGELLGGLPPL